MKLQSDAVTEVLLAIDTHVHVRACFAKDRYFDTVWNNALDAVTDRRRSAAVLPVLMLTESFSENAFGAIWSAAGSPGAAAPLREWGGWLATRTADGISVWLSRGDRRLLLISGRQIDTGEGLEVSVLGVTEHIPDYLPIEEILRRAKEAGGVSVIPWAPGKWLFGRGRKLHALLDEREAGGFYLGDNGGRPWVWPLPAHLRRGRRDGVPILPGSDPLPFPDEMDRTARVGVTIEAAIDNDRPGEHVKTLLRTRAADLRPYGGLANPVHFFARELKMQLTKNQRKSAAAASRAG